MTSRPRHSTDVGSRWRRRAAEVGAIVVVLIAVAVVLRLFVAEFHTVASADMAPAARAGEFALVTKYSEPARGDVVVFRAPSGWRPDAAVPSSIERMAQSWGLATATYPPRLMMRVVGLGGDVVQCCDDGHLVINGSPVDEPYAHGSRPGWVAVVPEGHVLVLADHRERAWDSACALADGTPAFVAHDQIVGVVSLVVGGLPRGISGAEHYADVQPSGTSTGVVTHVEEGFRC